MKLKSKTISNLKFKSKTKICDVKVWLWLHHVGERRRCSLIRTHALPHNEWFYIVKNLLKSCPIYSYRGKRWRRRNKEVTLQLFSATNQGFLPTVSWWWAKDDRSTIYLFSFLDVLYGRIKRDIEEDKKGYQSL